MLCLSHNNFISSFQIEPFKVCVCVPLNKNGNHRTRAHKDLLCWKFHERASDVIQLDEGKRKDSYSVQEFALGPVFIDSPYHADNFALKKAHQALIIKY